MVGWASQELEALDVGDVRRTLGRSTWSARWLSFLKVRSRRCSGPTRRSQPRTGFCLRGGHSRSPRSRLARRVRGPGRPASVVLAIQDTTTLNYTHHPATAGRGPLAEPHVLGFLVHSVLAVSAQGVPLGVLHQKQWARDPEASPTRNSVASGPSPTRRASAGSRACRSCMSTSLPAPLSSTSPIAKATSMKCSPNRGPRTRAADSLLLQPLLVRRRSATAPDPGSPTGGRRDESAPAPAARPQAHGRVRTGALLHRHLAPAPPSRGRHGAGAGDPDRDPGYRKVPAEGPQAGALAAVDHADGGESRRRTADRRLLYPALAHRALSLHTEVRLPESSKANCATWRVSAGCWACTASSRGGCCGCCTCPGPSPTALA